MSTFSSHFENQINAQKNVSDYIRELVLETRTAGKETFEKMHQLQKRQIEEKNVSETDDSKSRKWLESIDKAADKIEQLQRERYSEKVNGLNIRISCLESDLEEKRKSLEGMDLLRTENQKLLVKSQVLESQIAASRRNSVEIERDYSRVKHGMFFFDI